MSRSASLLGSDWLAYAYLAKLRILNQLAYRVEAFAGFVANVIPLIAMVFVWKAAYEGIGSVENVTAMDMITYTIISISLKDVFYCKAQDSILASVRDGSIAIELIRPVHPLGRLLAEDLAMSFGAVIRRFLPLVAFSFVFFQPPLPHSFWAALLFVVSCCFSYALLWLLSALVGMIAFWWMELGNLGMVKDAVVRLLSGSIVPLWFFPQIVQDVSVFLPFQYTFQTPLSIYIGKIGVVEALPAMGVQLIWVAVAYLCLVWAWKHGSQKVMVQGG